MPKKKGKGKKGKKDFLVDLPSLQPYGVMPRDIIKTPLGVEATVLGVRDGLLWLQFQGNVQSPVPSKAKTKADMEAFGYVRRPQSAHIHRSIVEREESYFNHRYYGTPGPKTAAMRLPWPDGSPAFNALAPVEKGRPLTAPP
uniref:Uncharacterized protein n=1 Tax=Haptolina ericina TaxID=156174 RepID=A0A7S3EZS9_9EUKA